MKKLFAALALAALTFNAGAQLNMATGDAKKGSTYGVMTQEMLAQCQGAQVTQVTSGSLQSLQLLMDNKVNLAFIQGDVLVWKSQQADASNIKVLMPMYPEEVHVIVRNSELKEGGVGIGGFRIGGSSFVVRDVSNLKNRKVGAVGGSLISANVISSTGKFGWTVVEYPDNQAGLKALAEGEVDGFVAVGGSPLAVVNSLDQRFRLAAFPQPMIDALSKYYVATKVSYPKMGPAGNVVTVATQSYLITQNYRGKKMSEALQSFRSCVYQNLDDIREATGTHAKWRLVPGQAQAQATSKWPLF